MTGLKKPANRLATTGNASRLYLNCLSKAALLECVSTLVAQVNGHADDPPSLDELREVCEPVLIARGDRVPRVVVDVVAQAAHESALNSLIAEDRSE